MVNYKYATKYQIIYSIKLIYIKINIYICILIKKKTKIIVLQIAQKENSKTTKHVKIVTIHVLLAQAKLNA